MKKFLAIILSAIMLSGALVSFPVTVYAEETVTVSDDTETKPIYLSEYSKDDYEKPDGTGTENDPYLITSADDLLWMAKEIGSDGTPTDAKRNPFDGLYFKQMKDIDLGGNILPSIGYYTGNKVANAYRYNGTDPHCVFGGIYDGNNKKIQNGYVTSPILNADRGNNAWGTGLFGVIYNATIKNLTLKNMEVYSYKADGTARRQTCVGLLVGVAVGGTTANAECNVIDNCHIDNSCSIMDFYTKDGRTVAEQALLHDHWGSLVGFAMDTTIRNCTNAADITVEGHVGAVGGLVGRMVSGVMENCVNRGNLTIEKTYTAKEKGTRAYGGLIGLIPDLTTQKDTVAGGIGVTVKNSVNCGNITVKDQGGNTCYYGGMVGAALELKQETYSISNCYNMGSIPGYGIIHTVTGSNLKAKETYSVITAQNALYATDAKITDINCGNKEKEEIDMLALCKLYIQKHNNDDSTFRFVATINSSDWKTAGFTVTLIKADGSESKALTKTVDKCYTQITAGSETVTDVNGRLYIAIAIGNLTATETKGYKVSAFVIDAEGNTYTTKVAAGEFT